MMNEWNSGKLESTDKVNPVPRASGGAQAERSSDSASKDTREKSDNQHRARLVLVDGKVRIVFN